MKNNARIQLALVKQKQAVAKSLKIMDLSDRLRDDARRQQLRQIGPAGIAVVLPRARLDQGADQPHLLKLGLVVLHQEEAHGEDVPVARGVLVRLVSGRADRPVGSPPPGMPAWDGAGRFSDLLKQDPAITRLLDPRTIDGLFDTAYHLKHVDTIFHRVFGE